MIAGWHSQSYKVHKIGFLRKKKQKEMQGGRQVWLGERLTGSGQTGSSHEVSGPVSRWEWSQGG